MPENREVLPRQSVTLSHGGQVSGAPEHVAHAVAIDRDMQRSEREWIADLRRQGVKAAHPDDGWVDRNVGRVHLCYPQFNDGLKVGDLLALGWPDRTRLVRITRTSENRLAGGHSGPWYFHFEEVADAL